MHPHFNSHLQNPNNQLQFNGANASAPQQVMRSQGNFPPSSMQVLPQFHVGMLNSPQLAMPPFANPNPYFVPTQFFPFPQGSLQNINANNLPQLFANNAINPSQFLPNGQLNLPNLLQNVNQLLQMQLPNCGPPNSCFPNAQLGVGNGNGVMQQSVDGNGLIHVNQNPAAKKDFGSPQGQRNHNVFSPVGGKSQSNAALNNNSWRKPHDKNSTGNRKHDASQRGFGKRQFNHQHNALGNFKFNKENRVQGSKKFVAKNFTLSNSSDVTQAEKKRSLILSYTEQEIRQWREQRRKNYPSNGNMEKKLKENRTQPEVTDEVAKIRRQQLKEILAKQAELGCEVAEIPSCYLSDSELHTDGRQQKHMTFGKQERFLKKFNEGKFHQNDFSKRQRSDPANLPNQSDQFTKKQRLCNDKKRDPSLLEKLLSSDIKRDKKHLLQVFRFMLTNSFFENGPEKPLKYPEVVVRVSGDECALVELKSEVVRSDNNSGNIAATTVDVVVSGERKEEIEEIMD